jgi:hypothetical protein
MSGIDALRSATRNMRLACWNPRIPLATTAPDTTAVVMSCALRDSVAFDIQEDILPIFVCPVKRPDSLNHSHICTETEILKEKDAA